ncbi:MAG: ABC transporter permease subunit [Anaerolineaceae bacterium]|nr:ABC transporter permease subunit [Anaerolineaceae bacterium]
MTDGKPSSPKAGTEAVYRWLGNVPWWMVIILIVGIITSFAVLSDTTYQEILRFVLGLPWDKDYVALAERQEDDSWGFTSSILNPGEHLLSGMFLDKDGNQIGVTKTYQLEIPEDIAEVQIKPLPETPGTETGIIINEMVKEVLSQVSDGVEEIQFVDDLTFWGTLRKIWMSNGVMLSIKITFVAYSISLVVGLIFGLGRVSKRNPDLSILLGRRLIIGLGVAVILIILLSVRGGISDEAVGSQITRAVLILFWVEVFMFFLPVLPYTISTLYVEVVRGIPLLVIILYMGFVVTPLLRDLTGGSVDLKGFPAATIGIAFGFGAYLAEVYRGGIESISRGQMEAARSLGMTYFEAMRHIVLPQAIRAILPPLGNDFIAMLKDSSLIAVIALPDLLQMGRLYISRSFRAFEGYNTVALLYLVMTFFLSLIVRMVERRMSIAE